MHFLLSLQRCCRSSSLQCFRKYTVIVKNCNVISSNHFLGCHSQQVRKFWDSFPYFRPLYYEKDGLSRDEYQLVYRSKMFMYAFYAQIASLSAFAGQFSGSLYHAYKSYVAGEVVKTLTTVGPFIVNYDMLTIFIIFIMNVQMALMYIAAQTTCLRIYYCEEADKYVFVTLPKLNAFKSQLVECKPGDLQPLRESIWNFLFGNHYIKGKRLFVRDDLFRDRYIYYRLITGSSSD